MRTYSSELRKERGESKGVCLRRGLYSRGVEMSAGAQPQKQFPFCTMVNFSCFLQIRCHHHVPQHAGPCIRDSMSEGRNHVSH